VNSNTFSYHVFQLANQPTWRCRPSVEVGQATSLRQPFGSDSHQSAQASNTSLNNKYESIGISLNLILTKCYQHVYSAIAEDVLIIMHSL